MEKYKKYMDSVEPSPELHETLLKLEAPKKKPAWAKYGALAAAVVLVVGLGVFGMSRLSGDPELGDPEPVQCAAPVPVESSTAIGEVALENPNGSNAEDGTKTIGGFEVSVHGGIAVRYCLVPYIEYTEGSTASVASLVAPEDSVQRELTEEDLLALVGGEEALTTMLDWGGFELGDGYVFHRPDGSVWKLDIWAEKEDMAFRLELASDQLPPDCLVSAEKSTTNVWGVEVTGHYSGMFGRGENREVWMPESREVSFVANGVGCRFTLYGLEGEDEAVEFMVARFVRQAILEGLNLSNVTPEGAVMLEPSKDPIYYGDSGAAPSQGPATEVSTPAYDPNGN